MFTTHFKKRLKQRTNIRDVDSFCERVISESGEIEKIEIYSNNLNSHPQIRNKLFRNPHQRVWVIDWENLYLFEENQYFKTIIPIIDNYISNVSGVEQVRDTSTIHRNKEIKSKVYE